MGGGGLALCGESWVRRLSAAPEPLCVRGSGALVCVRGPRALVCVRGSGALVRAQLPSPCARAQLPSSSWPGPLSRARGSVNSGKGRGCWQSHLLSHRSRVLFLVQGRWRTRDNALRNIKTFEKRVSPCFTG